MHRRSTAILPLASAMHRPARETLIAHARPAQRKATLGIDSREKAKASPGLSPYARTDGLDLLAHDRSAARRESRDDRYEQFLADNADN